MPEAYAPERLKLMRLLAERYATVDELCTEIVSISAAINLPKGTEHFMSDIHGEYEAFFHIVNNCSGVIREKVLLWLGSELTQPEVDELCTLIYYPREKMKRLESEGRFDEARQRKTLHQLIHLARMLTGKYTREKVRAALPKRYAFVLDELLHAQSDEPNDQHRYHEHLYDTLISIGCGEDAIDAACTLIKRLAVDRLHVVGDIFDRGPRADSIMDLLMGHHSVDIQWGNHDILWMGAACGNPVCIAAVVRNCLNYNNTQILENGYGISLRPLALFAQQMYPGDDLIRSAVDAITVIMFKAEGQLLRRHPEYGMEDFLLLHKLNREARTVEIGGRVWDTIDRQLPTVSGEDAYAFSEEEARVLEGLRADFMQSLRLKEHIAFLYSHGSMYLCYNENLLFHGCVPLDENGEFLRVSFGDGQTLSGKELLDWEDSKARAAWFRGDPDAVDFMWYLWGAPDSPLCGRKLTTFARYFIADHAAWEEPRNPYYHFYNEETKCQEILVAFGLSPIHSRIINGHTPIRVTHGESPLKSGGRLIVIDGGFCKAYQKTTGIAGYTLIGNSHGLRLMSHQPFTTVEDALDTGRDIHSQSFEFVNYVHRRMVRDTDDGRRLAERMNDLTDLLKAVRAGYVRLGE